MTGIQFWAQPWWVNLLFLMPIAAFFSLRRGKVQLDWRRLTLIAVFAVAFGFVEGAVVVYLRAAIGLLPGYMGTLTDLRRSSQGYEQARSIAQFPRSLLTIEVFREAATMLMLVSVAFLAARTSAERWAVFLWAFATWDITYYAALWATVRWPASLKDIDVLFLIPVPWISQVWFPILVSGFTLATLALAKNRSR